MVRYEQICSRFAKLYGETPKYFVRCPGLINLFGNNELIYGYGGV